MAVERSAAPIRRVRLASDHRLRRFWADCFLLRIYARRRFASGWLPRLSRQTQSRCISCSSPRTRSRDVMAQHDQGQTSSGLKPVPPLRLAGFEVPERLGNKWPTEPVLDELTAREHDERSDCPGCGNADVALVLVLSPNRPQRCLQHRHEAACRRPAAGDGDGPARPALDKAVVPPHCGAVERSTDQGCSGGWGRECLTAEVVDCQAPDRHLLGCWYTRRPRPSSWSPKG